MPYTYQKNADGLYVCEHCGKTTERQNTMHYHLKTHEGKLPFECSFCKRQFLHASTLELHKQSQHAAETKRLFHCPVPNCDYEGTLTKSNLLIHFVRKHCKKEATAAVAPGRSQATCAYCDKECKSMTSFHYHIASCMPLDTERLKQLTAIQAGTSI